MPVHDTAPQVLTQKQLAERWGVTAETAARRAVLGRIKSIRIGRFRRYRLEDVLVYEKTQPGGECLSQGQLCERWGISRWTLQRMIARGEMRGVPMCRQGRQKVASLADIEKFERERSHIIDLTQKISGA